MSVAILPGPVEIALRQGAPTEVLAATIQYFGATPGRSIGSAAVENWNWWLIPDSGTHRRYCAKGADWQGHCRTCRGATRADHHL
jgi:hypothetical protein